MNSLVEYSSSSDEEPLNPSKNEENEANHVKISQKRKLPIPEWLQHKSLKNDDETDNPEHHQGRQRSIKHERGIWATFLFIPIPKSDSIEEIQQKIIEYCNIKLDLIFEPIEDLHISVTKLLILVHHWIESFLETVSLKIKTLSSFHILFGELEVYCNDERTRTFLGIKTVDGVNLEKVTDTLDECLEEFKLPKYYETPSFHTSILWGLGDKSGILKQNLEHLQEICEKTLTQEIFQVNVSELLCKCGNRSYKFPLR